ncbi:hypothetical protein EI94DRAFT_1731536 [Lactarius quietus]|nr:hypothetical protein EI94DRAFT_1731536 [Lactarius quietus]
MRQVPNNAPYHPRKVLLILQKPISPEARLTGDHPKFLRGHHIHMHLFPRTNTHMVQFKHIQHHSQCLKYRTPMCPLSRQVRRHSWRRGARLRTCPAICTILPRLRPRRLIRAPYMCRPSCRTQYHVTRGRRIQLLPIPREIRMTRTARDMGLAKAFQQRTTATPTLAQRVRLAVAHPECKYVANARRSFPVSADEVEKGRIEGPESRFSDRPITLCISPRRTIYF